MYLLLSVNFNFPISLIGSTTGAVLAAVLFTLAGEWLRVVEEPLNLLGYDIPGIPGMRMVIFSFLLLLVILFFRRGLMDRREFSWAALSRLGKRLVRYGSGGERGIR